MNKDIQQKVKEIFKICEYHKTGIPTENLTKKKIYKVVTTLIVETKKAEREKFIDIMRKLATVYIHKSSKTDEQNTVIGVSMTDVLQDLTPSK